MLKSILLILMSFFAVVGFLECIIVMLETVSSCKFTQISDICLQVELKGTIDNVKFLLDTLTLQAERISYNSIVTRVVIKNAGLDENTYAQIYAFCLENDNITIEN